MLNQVLLIGNLGQDPARVGDGEQGPVRLRIATEEFNHSTGEVYTNWVTVLTWGKMATNCASILRKGMRVTVIAYIRDRAHTDDSGNKRYFTDIVARRVIFPPKRKPPAADTPPVQTEGGTGQ